MPRPLNERGFEVKEEFQNYAINYSIDSEGSEVVSISRDNLDHSSDNIAVYVIDGKVMRVTGHTKQATLFQDVKIDLMGKSEDGLVTLLGDDFSGETPNVPYGLNEFRNVMSEYSQDPEEDGFSGIKIPEEVRDLNYSQGLQIYRSVYKKLDIANKIKTYVPRFSSPSELSLYNLLGIERPEDIFLGEK